MRRLVLAFVCHPAGGANWTRHHGNQKFVMPISQIQEPQFQKFDVLISYRFSDNFYTSTVVWKSDETDAVALAHGTSFAGLRAQASPL